MIVHESCAKAAGLVLASTKAKKHAGPTAFNKYVGTDMLPEAQGKLGGYGYSRWFLKRDLDAVRSLWLKEKATKDKAKQAVRDKKARETAAKKAKAKSRKPKQKSTTQTKQKRTALSSEDKWISDSQESSEEDSVYSSAKEWAPSSEDEAPKKRKGGSKPLSRKKKRQRLENSAPKKGHKKRGLNTRRSSRAVATVFYGEEQEEPEGSEGSEESEESEGSEESEE
jgi:hypothetical protein